MPHKIIEDLELSQVTFLELINHGKYSKIYKVEVQGRVCVLKVVRTSREADILLSSLTAAASITEIKRSLIQKEKQIYSNTSLSL